MGSMMAIWLPGCSDIGYSYDAELIVLFPWQLLAFYFSSTAAYLVINIGLFYAS